MEELNHLSAIFPDKPTKELSKILFFHDGNVTEAVDAILSAEAAGVKEISFACNDRSWSTEVEVGAGNSISNESAMKQALSSSLTPNRSGTAAAAAASWWDSPTIVTPPPPPSRASHEMTQEQYQEEEESDLEAALKASMEPSDRGRLAGHGNLVNGQAISDATLEQLMHNPAFLAQLDPDLLAAINLQRRLDAEERLQTEFYYEPSGINNVQPHVPNKLSVSVRNRLKSLGESFLKRSTVEDKQLAVRLEEINRANVEHQKTLQELERVRKQAEAACLQTVVDHLDSFLKQHPYASYEEWVSELHPENAHHGALLEGLSFMIDHRFYVQESDHRKLWNERLEGKRRYVPVRQRPVRLRADGKTVHVVDLLGENGSVDSATNQDLLMLDALPQHSMAAASDNDLIRFE